MNMFSELLCVAVLGYLSFVTSAAPPVASVQNCNRTQWACHDGSCISFDGKCDGAVDCQDRSDETHALCRNTKCQTNWFRCTYGACVDATAPCNGVQECADNSDELLPRCRNATGEEIRGRFKCLDGSTIPTENQCDGIKDCADGSDEILSTCADTICPSYLFHCAYGACVDGGSECNNIQDCADNSDEADDLCNKNLPTLISSSSTTSTTTNSSLTATSPTTSTPTAEVNSQAVCILPPYPDHGTYVVSIPNAKPGDAFDFASINITCQEGYGVVGSSSIYCYKQYWSEKITDCVQMCHLVPHISVKYHCIVSGSIKGTRDCKEYEPDGTVASPECNYPNYYSATPLSFMHCINGSWDYIARCSPECGTVNPEGKQLIFNGYSAKHGEVPWHAGIYAKAKIPYLQICGGSIISSTIVISAGHCFWDNFSGKGQNASNYAVAVGKLYRPWNNSMEEAQRFDVKELHMPSHFRGATTNYQDDLAIVILSNAIKYETFVRPVCLDFDVNFDRTQLQPGKMGKVAGWGLTENATASQVLKVIDLPYVAVDTCMAESPFGFRAYITSDKICAGYKDAGSAVCQGDSGGGLAFPELDKGTQRYYLRGIVSTAPNDDTFCNANTYTSFTHVLDHEEFIKRYWRAQT